MNKIKWKPILSHRRCLDAISLGKFLGAFSRPINQLCILLNISPKIPICRIRHCRPSTRYLYYGGVQLGWNNFLVLGFWKKVNIMGVRGTCQKLIAGLRLLCREYLMRTTLKYPNSRLPSGLKTVHTYNYSTWNIICRNLGYDSYVASHYTTFVYTGSAVKFVLKRLAEQAKESF